jgi:trigger factor
MKITRNNVDALNAVLTLHVAKDDYAPKVESVLNKYLKTATVPGFRKGTVPMSLIRKQYGKTVLLEEVKKVIQESLNRYLQQEKIDILGNPLPVVKDEFNWDAEDFSFDFELGLTPEFSVKLDVVKNLTQYTIIADDKMLEEQVVRIRKQYGKMISKDTIAEGDDISGTFTNTEKGIDSPAKLTLDLFKDKKTAAQFMGKKVGDVVTVNTNGLFADDHQLMDFLKVSHDDVHGLAIDVNFTIEEVTTSELAELNQEFFDKLFGAGAVSSVAEVKAKIKEDAEKQFATQADQKFLNDVTTSLIENTKFELPATFLKKWIQTMGETPLSTEQAEAEYARSENGLRYQLIEGKIMADNKLQITFEDLKSYTAELIKKQMAQFGQLNPSDSEVEGIVARVLSNQEEVKRLSDQVMSEKMLNLFKTEIKAKTKEVNYDDFIKASYGEM